MQSHTRWSPAPLFWLLIALVILSGCSDDKPAAPHGISGVVVDANGDGISGAAVGLVYRFDGMTMPGDWDQTVGRPADKPTTRIKFDLPSPGPVTVEVRDYADGLIKVLLDETMPLGHYSLIWDATDAEGNPVPSGMYSVRITRPDQEPQIQPLFLYLFEDSEILRAPHTLTAADGSFAIEGALIPVGAQLDSTDESGQVTGTATVSSAIMIKAVIIANGRQQSDAQAIDWVPHERLAGLKLVLP